MATRKAMSRPHMRVMLDYMGLPFARHPKTVDAIEEKLQELRSSDPERYIKGYSVIVQKKMPSEASEMDRKANELSSIVDDILDERFKSRESEAVTKIREAINEVHRQKMTDVKSDYNEYRSHLESVNNSIQERIESELKKLNKKVIVIKEGKMEKGKVEETMPDQFFDMLELASQRKNILMVGPAGSGKTFMAGKIADALKLDFASQSCSAGMSESQLSGWLLPIGDSGKFVYVQSEFVRIYENGGVFLFDELDASDPNVLIFINQALANERFFLPQRFEKPLVKKHKNFVAVAAANTYGSGADAMYHARNALDAATLDRFKVGTVAIDYSDAVEESIVNEKVLEWGRKVRALIKANDLRRIMSTRVMKDATEMFIGQKWSLHKIAKAYFSDWSNEEIILAQRNGCIPQED